MKGAEGNDRAAASAEEADKTGARIASKVAAI